MVEPQYGVRYERSVRIPMPDGITLAADFFYPDAPGQFPLVFDYYPYRKSDSDWRAFTLHRYFAERGFVAARLDVRGSGDSEGTALDEYCPQEQVDGVAAIEWMARQPWCTGNVGMFGASYGGFNSLQVAMQRPPALKAIVPMMFTDRRYTDDCHYKGGALQMLYDVTPGPHPRRSRAGSTTEQSGPHGWSCPASCPPPSPFHLLTWRRHRPMGTQTAGRIG